MDTVSKLTILRHGDIFLSYFLMLKGAIPHDYPSSTDWDKFINRTARQYSPLRQKFMVCTIINPALSLLMKYLVIGQLKIALNFSAFHWSPHGSLVSTGQHFVTTRVVHLPKRVETSLIIESGPSGSNHLIGPGYAGRA